MKQLLCIYFLIASMPMLLAQSRTITARNDSKKYILESIDERDGFTQNSLSDIFQDDEGYLWLATPNGLFRYDGFEFDAYKSEIFEDVEMLDIASINSDTLSFASKHIINFHSKKGGWFKSLDIPEKYKRGDIQRVATNGVDDNLIWILINQKVVVLDVEYGEKMVIRKDINISRELNINYIHNILSTSKGDVWVVAGHQVILTRCTLDGLVQQKRFYVKGIKSSCVDSRGNLILLTNSHISTIKLNSEGEYHTTQYSIKLNGKVKSHFDNIIPLDDDKLLVTDYRKGLFFVDLISGNAIYNKMDFNENNKHFTYRTSCIDRSGVIWYGTMLGGLFKINLARKPFFVMEQTKSKINCQITGDNRGNIWVGTYSNGVVHENINNAKAVSNINQKLQLADNEDVSALCYTDGYLWYCNYKGLVRRAKFRDGSVDIESVEEVYKTNSSLSFFYLMPNNQLLLGNISGGLYLSPNPSAENVTFDHIRDENSLAPFEKTRITSLMIDRNKTLWIGTYNDAVYRAQIERGVVKSKEHVNLFNEGKGNAIFSIQPHNDDIYFATFGSGVIRIPIIDYKDKSQYKHYTTKEGLADNATYSIFKDKRDGLWISTDNGISYYDTVNDNLITYNTLDGVGNTNFRKWSNWQSDEGQIFFGGNRNVTYFTPENFIANNIAPDIVIKELLVMSKNRNHYKYIYKNDSTKVDAQHPTLNLKSDENNLRFNFTAIHYDNPSKSEYRYKLDGLDSEWHRTTATNRSAIYSYLPPGKYTFFVQAGNRDGVWSTYYTCINFTIARHWSTTILAQMIYILLLTIIIYFIFRYIYKDKMLAQEAKIHKVRLDFFTNISHEIKTPLTIISGVLDKMRLKNESTLTGRDLDIVKHNNERMLRLVSQLLNFRKVLEGHMPFTPTTGDITSLMVELSDNFLDLASHKKITLECEVPDRSIMIDFDSDKIEKIVSNLLSNAIQYTKSGGEVKLRLMDGTPATTHSKIVSLIGESQRDSFITIAISDTGRGISQKNIDNIFNQFYQTRIDDDQGSKSGIGIGLAYSKMLIELHNGFIYVDSIEGVGSTFYVLLPTQQSVAVIDNDVVDISSPSKEFAEESMSLIDVIDVMRNDYFNKHILIVEDDEEILELLNDLFSKEYRVHLASDGEQGYNMAISIIPDIIISDVMMPIMDGMELCQKLKSNTMTNHIPIILLTAKSAIEHQREGIKYGADAYISKPFDMEYLLLRVQKLIEKCELLKAKYMELSGHIEVESINIKSEDKEFIKRVEKIIEDNISNFDLSIDTLENALGYSRLQLYRKIKSITGHSVVEFIRNYRLKRSVDKIIEQISTDVRVNDILYQVGFSTPSYYTRIFKKRYGKTPKEFIKELKKNL